MLKGMAIATTVLVVSLGGAVALSSGTGCAAQPINTSTIGTRTVVGYSGDQLTNAAGIINIGTARGSGANAQTIAVMAAITQSDLKSLTDGDALGVFRLGEAWGSASQRLDPAGSASLFYATLERIPGWEEKAPGVAAQLTIGQSHPDDFTANLADAATIVDALGDTAATDCAIGADAQALAKELVDANADGSFVANTEPMQQIRSIADGRNVARCGIDTRILQIMVIAVRNFDSVGVSSINRLCTGGLLSGPTSSHVRDGGGKAVDFYMLDGRNLTGADGLSIRLIGLLDPIVPDGARVGQSNCRAVDDISLALLKFGQFADFCNHLHLDVANSTGAIRLP